MSIDLEAFEKAAETARTEIASVLQSPMLNPREERLVRVVQWMCVQIDSLTKKVAELETK